MQPYHGSSGAAVCVHLLDHYLFWDKKYALGLVPCAVGENFIIASITEDLVREEDIVLIGRHCFKFQLNARSKHGTETMRL